jgi:hypothetical protein
MVKPTLRTKSIGFKVSEDEYAQLERGAQAQGATIGEWCRTVVLAHSPAPVPTPETITAHALMAELVALRSIVLTVVYQLARGERPSEDAMQRLSDRADEEKRAIARDRLARAAESAVPSRKPS